MGAALRGFGMGSAKPMPQQLGATLRAAPRAHTEIIAALTSGDGPRYAQGTPGRQVVEEVKAAEEAGVQTDKVVRSVDDKSGIHTLESDVASTAMKTTDTFMDKIAALPTPVKIGGALVIAFVVYQLVKE